MDALLERIAVALERLADGVDRLSLDTEPAEAAAEQGCNHPENRRLEKGATQWVCEDCGYVGRTLDAE